MLSIIKFFVIALFTLSISFLNLAVYADPGHGHGGGHGKGPKFGHGKSNGYGHGHSVGHGKTKTKKELTHFTTSDRTTITNFFNKNPIPASALPPGIAMNLARGKPLPPGIAKRFLPSELVSTLPPRPGYEYLLVGDDAVLVNSTTGLIADIIANVLK